MSVFPLASNTLTANGVRMTWQDCLAQACSRLDPLRDTILARRAAFVVHDPMEALEAVAFALDAHLDFAILEASRLSTRLADRLNGLGIARLDMASLGFEGLACAESGLPGRVSVMTSGTTGLIKPVTHTWRTLNTFDRVRDQHPRSWFVPYQPGSYAWYQMVCMGAFSPDQDLHFGPFSDPIQGFRKALDAGVTAVSSTPTFWRYAFLNIEEDLLLRSRLETISLGGEIVDQDILDRLAAAFPGAGIRHIYASSEAGAAIVVTDGRAGFPASRLRPDEDSAIALKVSDGRLYVRSPYTTAAATSSQNWIDTGDLVELHGDRVHFLGRAESSMINVGGLKAYPAEIEARLMEHPNVAWAQVYARRAPMVGSLVAARIVLQNAAADPKTIEAELSSFARQSMPEHAVPRFWEFRREIPLSPSLKSWAE
jgi:acyl-coenzyme A synthetase/AMP-(fatty) acid ligase